MLNYIKYYIRNAFYSVATLFTSASVLQIFLTELGFSSMPISIFTSLLSAVNVVTSIAFSSYADRCRNIKRFMALLCLPMGSCFLLLIPLCFAQGLSSGVLFALITVVCLTQAAFLALYTALDYKLPYSIIEISQYGRFASINGIITGIVSTAASYILSAMIAKFPYFTVLSIGFAVGGGCMGIAAIVNSTFDTSWEKKQLPARDVSEKTSVFAGLKILLREPDFRQLMLPNLLRGVHTGMLGMAAVVAISCELRIETANQLVTISFLCSLLGSFLFMLTSQRIGSSRICLIASLVTGVAVLMPFCSDGLFLAVYFVAMLAKILIDYAVPTLVYARIKPDIACLYQTWRLILTTIGSVFSAAIAGVFIEGGSVTLFLVLASLCQVLSGLGYFRWSRPKKQ